MTKLWVAVRVVDADGSVEKGTTGILGIYDSEEKAIAGCETTWDFIGPLLLNKPVLNGSPEERKWSGVYYPLAKAMKEAETDVN